MRERDRERGREKREAKSREWALTFLTIVIKMSRKVNECWIYINGMREPEEELGREEGSEC